MNLKLFSQKFLLAFINFLFYPFVLGYYSDNDHGNYCITNKDCTKIRYPGYGKWQDWNNNPGYLRVYNEYVEVVRSKDISLKTLWYILTRDWVEPKVFFAFSFILLETIALLAWTIFYLLGKPLPSMWNITEIIVVAVLMFTAINAYIQLLMKK